MKKWLSDKKEQLLELKILTWIKIIAGVIAILTGLTGLIDWWGDHFIYRKFFSPTLKIEQTVSPEMLNKIKKDGLVIEKGITIRPREDNGNN